nr:hypothetical protein [Candidatus Sigynarchaeota archaeon]
MALRKQPVNVGILSNEDVIYVSDLDIRPVLDLAKFSMSFAKNLVRDAQLVEIIHEPSMVLQQGDVKRGNVDSKLHLITREHILFKFLTNPQGDNLAICATYPSNDDLKGLDIANLTPEQLSAQARSFLEAFTKRLTEELKFDSISLAKYTQEQYLQLHQTMYTLYDEVIQASQVVFKDDYAQLDRVEQNTQSSSNTCSFLFASVMHSSVPCASRFFENMEGFFKVKIDADSDASSIIENLISAQLSTIVTTALSVARTLIRQVELKINGPVRDDTIDITFFPIKNNYTLVLISKGNPTKLRFFTEATANMFAGLDVLDEKFIGDLPRFAPVVQMLRGIPPSIESSTKILDLDEMVEDLDSDMPVAEQKNTREKKKAEEIDDELDEAELQFNKVKNKFFKAQDEINTAMAQNKIKVAVKKTKDIWMMSLKIKNYLMAIYYENKFNALSKLLEK